MSGKLWMFDCDGVTADFQSAAIKWHNRVYGTNHTLDQLTQFSIGTLWRCSQEEELRRLDEFYHTEYFDNIEPIDGAVYHVDSIRLLEEGYRTMTLTARPENLKVKTNLWFGRHFPNRFEKIILSEAYKGHGTTHASKVEICLGENAYGIIEDSSANAVACYNQGMRAIVLNQPWNARDELPKGVLRARNWEEVVELISKG